jgi:hypothetical protein
MPVVTGGTVVILLVLVLVLLVGGLVVPFCVGLVRGPRRPPGPAAASTAAPPMRPLGTIARIYGGVMLLYLLLAVFEAKDGFFGSGGGPRGAACVNTSMVGSLSPGGQGWRIRPGASLGPAGDLSGCVLHPTAGQWTLFALTKVPSLLLWAGVLLMIVRLVRHAARRGPFTPRAATLMRNLGMLILAGCAVVGALHAIGTDVLTDAVLAPRPFGGQFITEDALLRGPLQALLPIPALAGIALLSFASITKTGAVMDEELRATV